MPLVPTNAAAGMMCGAVDEQHWGSGMTHGGKTVLADVGKNEEKDWCTRVGRGVPLALSCGPVTGVGGAAVASGTRLQGQHGHQRPPRGVARRIQRRTRPQHQASVGGDTREVQGEHLQGHPLGDHHLWERPAPGEARHDVLRRYGGVVGGRAMRCRR